MVGDDELSTLNTAGRLPRPRLLAAHAALVSIGAVFYVLVIFLVPPGGWGESVALTPIGLLGVPWNVLMSLFGLAAVAVGELEGFRGSRGERDVARAAGLLFVYCGGNELDHAVADVGEGHGVLTKKRAGLPAVQVTGQQAQQQVLGADVAVAEVARLFLGQDHDTAGAVGEPLEHRPSL